MGKVSNSFFFNKVVIEDYNNNVCLITVLNINDNPPRFSQLVYTCWLSEEASQGQLVTVVTACDPDSDQLFYKIVSGNEHHTFNIHEETGM